MLDLDALAASEKANWVWKGASCARPAERRCLISLSDGGEDAVTIREFDVAAKSFVADGFILPKGKQDASYIDENELLLGREWTPGLLTKSGYAYVVKRLKRGQPLSAAREVYRGTADDVGSFGAVLRDGDGRSLSYAIRATDFFNSENFILTAKGPQRLGIPARGEPGRHDRRPGHHPVAGGLDPGRRGHRFSRRAHCCRCRLLKFWPIRRSSSRL